MVSSAREYKSMFQFAQNPAVETVLKKDDKHYAGRDMWVISGDFIIFHDINH